MKVTCHIDFACILNTLYFTYFICNFSILPSLYVVVVEESAELRILTIHVLLPVVYLEHKIKKTHSFNILITVSKLQTARNLTIP